MNTKEITNNLSLKSEQFGSPISELLSSALKKYTGNNDRANVSIKTGIGTSTVRDVVYRNNNLTEDNSRAIIELTAIAIENCSRIGQEANADAKLLKKILVEDDKE